MRYQDFEQQLLDLAMRTTDPITAAFVAYNLRIGIAQSQEGLDRLAVKGHLSIESDDDGNIFYDFPNLPRGSVKAPAPRVSEADTKNNVRLPVHRRAAHTPMNGYSPGVAALLSFLWPGAGQIYRGEVASGFGFMIATFVGYLLFVVPGLVMHVISVVNAARRPELPPLPALAVIPPLPAMPAMPPLPGSAAELPESRG